MTSFLTRLKTEQRIFRDSAVRKGQRNERIIAVNGGLIFIDESGNLNYNQQTYAVENIDTTIEHNLVMFGNNVVILPDNLLFSLENKNFSKINIINDKATCDSNINVRAYANKYNFLYSKCAIEKVDLCVSGNARTVNCIVEQHIDFTDLDYQKKQSDGSFHYVDIFKNINVGDTVENTNSLPSVLYRCTSIEDAPETGVYIDNKIRRFVKVED